MSKIAILADIHSNLAALEAVFEDMDREGPIDRVICLGDVVGYGPQPKECLDLLLTRASPSDIILGNHEAALIGKKFLLNGKNLTIDSYFHEAARKAINWTLTQLQDPDVPAVSGEVALRPKYRFLLDLKCEIIENEILFVHAMLDKEDLFKTILYIDENDQFKNAIRSFNYMKKNKFKLNFHGHHHVPGLWYIHGAKVKYNKFATLKGYEKETELNIDLPKKSEALINVGSVGQPRDGDIRASYGIVTIFPNKYTYKAKRVPYDSQKTFDLIQKIEDLDKRFAERLIYKFNLSS
ncbi:MAG: metallophosphoesterase [Planctomycetota bacterium]